MRDYKIETEKRVAFIKEKMAEAHASGLIFGNSGGKDSALAGILCTFVIRVCATIFKWNLPKAINFTKLRQEELEKEETGK